MTTPRRTPKQSTGQGQGQSTGRDRCRTLGRLQTEQQRAQHDESDCPGWDRAFLPGPGRSLASRDLGRADDEEGDDSLAEDPEGETPSPLDDQPVPEDVDPAETPLPTLSDILGSRAPRIILRLRRDGDALWVEDVPHFRPDLLPSLDRLALLVAARFEAGRSLLAPDEWERLLGSAPATPAERLLLLTRLAVRGNTKIDLGPQAGTYVPNNVSLGRYAGKFAALPDGLPFSLRLLLLDGQGKRHSSAARPTFNNLPYAIQLQALARALAAERADGLAATDDQLRDALHDALKAMSLDIPKPTYANVRGLREKLKEHGVPELFPNKDERQRAYDEAPAGGRP